MKLVDNWKQCYRWISTICMAANIAILTTWATIPEDWKSQAEPKWVYAMLVGTLVTGMVGRLIDQTRKTDAGDDNPNS